MTRPVGKTYYGLLGVSPSASQMELDAAYRSMQAILSEIIDIKAREARQHQLEEAYQLLSNTTRRAIYDASLQAGQAQTVVIGASSAKAARPGTRSNKQPVIIGLAVAGVLLIGGYAGWHWQAAKVAEKAKQEQSRAGTKP
ncbi:DnaJ domain-containing protein [Chitinimonas viridis]|uniref:DnaJ domain-containing protein n=1 Tax=Chitinimonas viridis TaxID=664880 RepID=A0ABT8B9Y4_9NEIS|nr:DnaJ domain-containing protein [Chitinimonas viridis]MDN3578426.1 DnaJ domain-containing protein [Chitinimonas viridis]